MAKTYAVVDPQGETRALEITDAASELALLQEAVGGYVEVVLAPGLDVMLIVNEEGWLRGMQLNERASSLAGQPVAGTVVVTGLLDGEDFTEPPSYVFKIMEIER